LKQTTGNKIVTLEKQKQGITNHILNGELIQAKQALDSLPDWHVMTGKPVLSLL